MCIKHYTQVLRHGRILERTRFDKNIIVCGDDICEMELYDKACNVIGKTKFDKGLFKTVSQYKWHLHLGYPVTVLSDRTSLYLHQLVIGSKLGFVIDHISTDKLDNRAVNLRFATIAQNQWNRKADCVHFDMNRGKWVAKLICNKKVVFKKRFNTYQEAIEARINAEQKFFGSFAVNNHPLSPSEAHRQLLDKKTS
ncbi:MAG: HNH endonuclease [Syntrophobacteraceae bacterium]